MSEQDIDGFLGMTHRATYTKSNIARTFWYGYKTQFYIFFLEGEDYRYFKQVEFFDKDSHRCVAVVILDDQQPEEDETFLLFIEKSGIATRVVILDDDGMLLLWVYRGVWHNQENHYEALHRN